MKLGGRFALITGASQGLGAEIARHYVTNGASVMLCARGADKLAATQQSLAPLLASGARIVLHLAHALRARGLKRGMASICIGGGQGGAMMVEAC